VSVSQVWHGMGWLDSMTVTLSASETGNTDNYQYKIPIRSHLTEQNG
jgi:hypothetical protein